MTRLRIHAAYDLDPCRFHGRSQGALEARKSTVYTCTDAASRIVYIGRSDRVGKRLKQHRKRSWWSQVASVQITWFCCFDMAAKTELALIYKHRPPNQLTPGQIADLGRATRANSSCVRATGRAKEGRPLPVLARLIEAKLRDAGRLEGGSLHAWLQARRPDPGAKVSWDDIARDLWMLTHERVSGPAVAGWYATMQAAAEFDQRGIAP